MLLKKYKPVTPSLRNHINISNKSLNKVPILKSKIRGYKKSSGKNHLGQITVYHKGSGHKNKYRDINLVRNKNSTGIILSLEYDPFRNANIASVYDLETLDYYYITSPGNLKVGDVVKSSDEKISPRLGFSLPIANIPVGVLLHNIARKPNKRCEICRSAGTYATLLEKNNAYSRLKLRSGEVLFISNRAYATVGVVSNHLHALKKKGKAGRNRWLNIRPTVRGVAMNPVDHPHGGGEGKTSGRKVLVSPWGKLAKRGGSKRK